MKTFYELFKKFYNMKTTPADVGIEIETETLSPGDYPQDFFVQKITNEGEPFYHLPAAGLETWYAKKDGSLRNFGMEYVLHKPLTFAESRQALVDFAKATEKVKFIPNAPSTSVHVHLNFGKRSVIELANFLTLWVLFENILVEFCGETRRSNLFALPARVAEGVVDNIIRMFQGMWDGDVKKVYFDPSTTKYGAVNIATLTSLGSVELRCFRGTTDTKDITTWLDVLEELYKFCQVPGLTPPEIILAYRRSPEEFYHEVFPKNGKLLAQDINLEGYIERNVWYAADIAYCVENWDDLEDKIPETKSAAKKKDKPVEIHQDIELELQSMYGASPLPPQPTLAALAQELLQPTPFNDEWTTIHVDDDD